MWKSTTCLFFALFLLFSLSSAQLSLNNTQISLSTTVSSAGTAFYIIIQPRDASNNPITGCTLAPDNANPFTATFNSSTGTSYTSSKCKPGVNPYTLQIISTKKGYYSVSVIYQGQVVGPNQSYPFQTVPGQIYAQNSQFFGNLNESYVGIQQNFSIVTFDQYKNYITTCVSNFNTAFSVALQVQSTGQTVNGQVTSCNDETAVYTAEFITQYAGVTFLTVSYIGNTIPPSPYALYVSPGIPYGPNSVVYTNGSTEAGLTNIFQIAAFDQLNNQITTCETQVLSLWVAKFYSIEDPTNATKFVASEPVCDLESGLLTFTYSYTIADNYLSNCYYNDSDSQVRQFNLSITPLLPPANIDAEGPGVERSNPNNRAGVLVYFNITSSDQYGNIVYGCLSQQDWNITSDPPMPQDTGLPSNPINPPNCSSDAQTMMSGWLAYKAIEYKIYVSFNGSVALHSPYTVNVYSSYLVGNTSSLFVPNGPFPAGISIPFTISGFDVYGNSIDDCQSVDTNSFAVQLNNVETGSVINGNVTCSGDGNDFLLSGNISGTVSGNYTLSVTYDGLPLQNSPSLVTIIPGYMVVSNTVAVGTGFTPAGVSIVAGEEYKFLIEPRDEYNNIITNCSFSSGGWSVDIFAVSLPVNTTTKIDDCAENGTYEVKYTVFNPTQNLSISVNNNGVEISNQGSVLLTPGPFDLNTSVVSVQPEAEVGANVLVEMGLNDRFGNPILNCTNPSQFIIFAAELAAPDTNSTGTVFCDPSGTFYKGTFLAKSVGEWYAGVGYGSDRTQVGKTGLTTVDFGTFSPTNGNCSGEGVGYPTEVPITAGVPTNFTIYLYNEYGYWIPASDSTVQTDYFNVTATGVNTQINSVPFDLTYTIVNETDNQIFVSYFLDTAQPYNIYVSYNGTSISVDPPSPVPYNITVIPGPLDPSTIMIYNLTGTDGQGSFYINATDLYGNPVALSNSTLYAYLSPECVNQNVSCFTNDDLAFQCNYVALQGGIYCISVSYEGAFYPVADSSFVVVGGVGCSNEKYCNNNGYCFQTEGGEYECNCIQGYTGSSCSDKISSKYMSKPLAIGLIVGVPLVLLIIAFVIGCLLGRRNRNPNLLT